MLNDELRGEEPELAAVWDQLESARKALLKRRKRPYLVRAANRIADAQYVIEKDLKLRGEHKAKTWLEEIHS